jgi:GT2 family glycosyltransferase
MADTARPRVDAVVVAWNSAAHIGACVESLARQRGVDVHVTVVDNASPDDSAAIAARTAAVQVLRVPRNVGYTRGLALGVAAGSSPYVLLCNPDVDADPDAVALLVDALQRYPGAGGAVPRLVGPDGQPRPMLYRYPRLSDAFFCFTEVGQRLDVRLGGAGERRYQRIPPAQAAPVERPSDAFLLLRRPDAERLLDPGFPLFFADTELCRRLQSAGRSLWYVPTAVVRHVQAASVEQLRSMVILHELQRSLRRFYALHEPRRRRLALDALLIADAGLRTAARGLRRRRAQVVRDDLDLLSRLLSDRPAPDAPWVEGGAAEAAVAEARAESR